MITIYRTEQDGVPYYQFSGPPDTFLLPLDAVEMAEADAEKRRILGETALFLPEAFDETTNVLRCGADSTYEQTSQLLSETAANIIYHGAILAVSALRTERVAKRDTSNSPEREQEAAYRRLYSHLYVVRTGGSQGMPRL